MAKVIVGMTMSLDGAGSAIAQATAAAGDKAVQVVGGPSLAQELLSAGLVDELRVDVMPVLLGSNLRFLKDEGIQRVQLEKIGVQEIGPRTSLRFRVKK